MNRVLLQANIKRFFSYFKIKSGDQVRDFLFHYTYLSILIKSILSTALIVNDSSDIKNLNLLVLLAGFVLYSTFVLITMSFSLLFKGRKRLWYLVILNLAFSVLLVFDIWYYRGFGAFLSVQQLGQLVNLDNLGDSIFSMSRQWDFLFVIDAIGILIASIFVKKPYRNIKRNVPYFFIFLMVPIILLSIAHYEMDIKKVGPQRLFDTFWTPAQTITDLSPIGYHFFDVYSYFKDLSASSISSQEKKEIEQWYRDKQEDLPDNKYKGMFKGKNLLVLQVESLENFVINQSINGEEITPTLNRILKNSIYFPNIYEQVNLGTSSDADLMINTSVYPIRKGSTFFRYPNNTYNSLPKLMQSMGYSTTAIHSDKGGYWNWMPALKSIGFQKCIDSKSFVHDEEIGLGLSDGSYFRQLVPKIVSQKQPFFNFIVTLSSHGPFNIPQKYRSLNLDKEFDSTKLGGYFQSFHYTDEKIGKFLDELDQNHLLDNTVVVIYGDHCGVHKYYQDELYNIKPQENWWLEKNRCVPLIIYQKNMPAEKLTVTGGQIDIMPTISYLMGIDKNNFKDTAMGRILVNTNRDFAVLNNRTYVGSTTDEKTKNWALKGIDFADKIISSNYFYPAYSNKKK